MRLKEHKHPEQVVYFDRVRRALRDVPRPMRDELLADLRARLDELPRSTPPVDVFGTGEEYARLAREGAGYGPSAPRRLDSLRSWSPRRKIAAAAALLVLVVATTTGVFVAHYQPVVTQNLWFSSNAPVIETNVPVETQYWRYQPGAVVTIGTGLLNRGRTTVTVTGVSVPNTSGPFVPTELRFTRDVGDMGLQRGTTARRFKIRPGETVYVTIVMKMSTVVLGNGDSESEDLPTLHIEVLGVHHRLPISGNPIGVLKQS